MGIHHALIVVFVRGPWLFAELMEGMESECFFTRCVGKYTNLCTWQVLESIWRSQSPYDLVRDKIMDDPVRRLIGIHLRLSQQGPPPHCKPPPNLMR